MITTNMTGTTPNVSFFSPLVEQLVWGLFLFKQDLFHWTKHLTTKQPAITLFKAIFLGNVTLVSHQKRLAKNLRFEKEKHISDFRIYYASTGPIQPSPYMSTKINSTGLDQKDNKTYLGLCHLPFVRDCISLHNLP